MCAKTDVEGLIEVSAGACSARQQPGDVLQVHGLHTPRYMLDEEVLHTGAAYLATLAADFLAQHASISSREEL